MTQKKNETSFEENTIQDIHLAVDYYKQELVDKEYLLISSQIDDKKVFHITGKSNNFLHLTGVKTPLKTNQFYSYALNKKLKPHHIIIPNPSAKGSVRRKRKSLLFLKEFFTSDDLYLEEEFRKNKIYCKLATANQKCTLGFIEQKDKLVPSTLLKNDELNKENKKLIDLIISKPKGTRYFNTLEKGSLSLLNNYPDIFPLLDDELIKNNEVRS
ncbi:PBECR4 domain-containing protein [Vagococcus fluvialis]|uniref:PBECR4 domain-containing protein n=1 Tax=Vagococcus fluvialis TaxID=2738 RepID=UPI003B5AED01